MFGRYLITWKSLAKYERRLEIDPDISVKETLERLSLIKGEKLTNAALLLFGKSPQRYFLQTEVRCARFKGTEAIKPFIDMKVFGGDITEQVNKALNFVLELNLESYILRFQIEHCAKIWMTLLKQE